MQPCHELVGMFRRPADLDLDAAGIVPDPSGQADFLGEPQDEGAETNTLNNSIDPNAPARQSGIFSGCGGQWRLRPGQFVRVHKRAS